jgi:hypothetical protein
VRRPGCCKGTISSVWDVAGAALAFRAEAELSRQYMVRLAFDDVHDRSRLARLAVFRRPTVVEGSL